MVAHKTEKVWKKCFPNLVLNLVTSFESCHESCHESCPVWHLMGLSTDVVPGWIHKLSRLDLQMDVDINST